MPFQNFHAFRVKTPGEFKGALATRTIAPGITILHGFLKNPPKKKTGRVVQTYRFRASSFTFSEAKKWMKSHKVKYIISEKAVPKKKNESVVTLEGLAERLKEKLESSFSIS